MHCWDHAKNEANRVKHGVDFAAAVLVFEALTVEFEVQDSFERYGESRINAYGIIADRLFLCVYTPRCGWRHIISLRRASKKEVELYG